MLGLIYIDSVDCKGFGKYRVQILPFIAALFLMSCATTPSLEQIDSQQDIDPQEEPVIESESLPIKDVLEEGFCYDDIFGTYLREKYVAGKAKEIRKIRSSRRRRAKRRYVENQSLFYARSHLVGPLTPYFGALPVASNRNVEFWIRYFKTRGRSTFIKWLVRAQSFKGIVDPLLREEGLPPEMFFLAMVESGFSNHAYSRKRATGTWQFMKPTARHYNLKINHWVDERRDPAKSTVAAARYLRDLYKQFGDWYLAMAAYNAGPGKIRRAIRKTKSRDFWEISKTRYIRKETRHYVPKVLAALNLSYHAKQHGFEVIKDPNDSIPNTHMNLTRAVKMDELARHLGVKLSLLKKWNPEIITGITPPPRGGPYKLRVASHLVNMFAAVEPKLTKLKITDTVMHKVRKGETLSHIARRYKVRISQIKAVNPKLRPRTLRIGKVIAIPIPGFKG